jgi:uncharacterized DUF497 family protein
LVFDDPFHISVQDREVDGEARWQTIGMVNGVHLLLVAPTVDEEANRIRILSARKATRRERSIYSARRLAKGKYDEKGRDRR